MTEICRPQVIFIDKPLPQLQLSGEERKSWYIKVATKAFFLHPWTRSVVNDPAAARITQSQASKGKLENLDYLANALVAVSR